MRSSCNEEQQQQPRSNSDPLTGRAQLPALSPAPHPLSPRRTPHSLPHSLCLCLVSASLCLAFCLAASLFPPACLPLALAFALALAHTAVTSTASQRSPAATVNPTGPTRLPWQCRRQRPRRAVRERLRKSQSGAQRGESEGATAASERPHKPATHATHRSRTTHDSQRCMATRTIFGAAPSPRDCHCFLRRRVPLAAPIPLRRGIVGRSHSRPPRRVGWRTQQPSDQIICTAST